MSYINVIDSNLVNCFFLPEELHNKYAFISTIALVTLEVQNERYDSTSPISFLSSKL